jgi:IclR family acetate operon transcriptional repressor
MAPGANDAASVAPSKERDNRVQSVDRAIGVLQILAEDPFGSLSALEISRRSGLDRTVVHRLLRTLASHDLVAEQSGRYVIGSMSSVLSLAYIERIGLRQAALPYAVELHTKLLETPWIVSLAIPAWECAILIDRLWKPQAPLSTMLGLGARLPLQTSAIGRCLLAYGHPHAATEGEAEAGEALEETLELIRQAGGVELSHDEIRPGIGAMAAAITNHRGVPVGAISVSGPEITDHLVRQGPLAHDLRATAHSISTVVANRSPY